MESLRRIVTVLTSPSATFRRIAERPTWLVPLLVLLLLAGVVGSLASSKIDPAAQEQAIREQMEERGMAGPELDEAVDRVTGINAKLRPFLPAVVVGVSLLTYLLVTVVLWGGVRLAGGDGSFVTGLSTTLHGFVPQGLAALISIPILLATDSIDPQAARSGTFLASNLAALAPADASTALVALLGSLDFFAVWSLVLLVLGFHVTARVSKGTSGAVVVGAWILWVAAKVGLAALFG